jgi:hypothetical protein
MILNPVRTKNIQLELEELSIGDSIDLCEISDDLHELGTTMALKAICKDKELDTRMLTVQERSFIIAQYHAQTAGDDPDFVIGEAKFSDYLVFEEYEVKDKFLVEHAGDKWHITPLLGIHTEGIERLILQERLESKRHNWWLAAMTCMLFNEDDKPAVDWASLKDAEIDEYIMAGVNAFKSYSETDFIELLGYFLDGVKDLDHLFHLNFQDYGIAFAAIPKEGGEAVDLPPARFHFNTAISEVSFSVFGNSEE